MDGPPTRNRSDYFGGQLEGFQTDEGSESESDPPIPPAVSLAVTVPRCIRAGGSR